MNRFFITAIAIVPTGLLLMFATSFTASAENSKGADSFDANCAECHSLARPPRNKKGPNLIGIFGRKAAQIPGVEYSEAMKASGIVWDHDTLDHYIEAPKKVVPGGKMKFDGLSDAAERKDLLEFLEDKTR